MKFCCSRVIAMWCLAVMLATGSLPALDDKLAGCAILETKSDTERPNDGVDLENLAGVGVYLGQYDHVSAMTAEYTRKTASSWTQPATAHEGQVKPVLWHVMGAEGVEKSIVLLSEHVIESRPFHTNDAWLSFDYAESAIREWLNGSFLDNAFSEAESGALVKSEVIQNMWNPDAKDWVNGSFTTLWGSGAEHTTTFPKIASGDKVYLPWREYNSDVFHWDAANKSADEYVISGETAKIRLRSGKTKTDTGDSIWALSRSPMPESANHILPGNYTVSSFGIRPVVKLSPSNIIYAQLVDGENYKLTLLNKKIETPRLISEGTELSNGNTINVPVGLQIRLTNIAKLYDKLTYKIVKTVNGKRTIIFYGSGKADEVTVLNNLDIGCYDIYIWSQTDSKTSSNEASEPVHCIFNVKQVVVHHEKYGRGL